MHYFWEKKEPVSYTHLDVYKRQDLNHHSVACDLVSVAEALTKNGQIELVGGMEYLATLTNEVPSAANAAY